jgi:hypothetical protein
MLLTDEEVQERIESPLNLLNRLRHASKAHSPLLPPKSGELIPDLDEKLEPDVKKQATKIMNAALKELEMRIPDVQKPEKLALIAETMNKVIVAREDKDKGSNAPQVIVYAPQVIQESHFETIIVQE